MKQTIFYLTILTLFLSSCNPTANLHKGKSAPTAEPFETFYHRFFADDSFQLSRIPFPIKGFDSDDYEEALDKYEGDVPDDYQFFWTKKNWVILPPYQKTIDNLEKEIIDKGNTRLERIWIPDSGYEITFIYTLRNGKWYLTEFNYHNM